MGAMTDLHALKPSWVTLTSTVDGTPVITLVDEAVALAAPFASHPLQVGLGVRLNDPDALGQPGESERDDLKRLERGVVDALGTDARLVASITLQGIREYVAYAVDGSFLQAWTEEAPDGLNSHEVQVMVMEDPTWKGLREIAGLLEPGEAPLRPGEEVQPT